MIVIDAWTFVPVKLTGCVFDRQEEGGGDDGGGVRVCFPLAERLESNQGTEITASVTSQSLQTEISVCDCGKAPVCERAVPSANNTSRL